MGMFEDIYDRLKNQRYGAGLDVPSQNPFGRFAQGVAQVVTHPMETFAPTTGTIPEAISRGLPFAGEAWTADDIKKSIAENQYGSAALMTGLGLLPLGGYMAGAIRQGAKNVPGMFGQTGAIATPLYRATNPEHMQTISETMTSHLAGSVRGTGHFGTGEYFVSSPERTGGLAKGRIIQESKVPEGLFEPKNSEQAFALHDALREINNSIAFTEKYTPELEKKIKRYFDNAGLDVSSDEIRDTFAYGKKISRLPPVESYKKAEGMDSASTFLMKKLGYKGVDVTGIPELDNTMYGSVIYRNKDATFPLTDTTYEPPPFPDTTR